MIIGHHKVITVINCLCMTFDSHYIFCCKTKILPLVAQFRKANGRDTNYVTNCFMTHLLGMATCIKQSLPHFFKNLRLDSSLLCVMSSSSTMIRCTLFFLRSLKYCCSYLKTEKILVFCSFTFRSSICIGNRTTLSTIRDSYCR